VVSVQSLYIFVFIYRCIHVYIRMDWTPLFCVFKVYIHSYNYKRTHNWTPFCVFEVLYIYVCVYTCTCIYMYIHIYTYIYMCIHVYMYIYTYMYIYIYMCIHVYMYIYIYTVMDDH